MPKAQLAQFSMNYELHRGLAPMDTLFIHGNIASNRWWHPSLDIWKNKSEGNDPGQMILAEWRGCGDSSTPLSEDELSPENLAKDYVSLLKYLGVKKAHIVGHSTGGVIALYALLQAPELFDRVVLLNSVGAKGVQFQDEVLRVYSQMSLNRTLVAMSLGNTIYNNDLRNPFFQKLVDDAMRVAQPVWLGVPKALRQINIVNELPKIKHKVLVLHGEHDIVLPVSSSENLARGLPNAQFVKVDAQAHCMNVENPARFVSLVSEFLYNR